MGKKRPELKRKVKGILITGHYGVDNDIYDERPEVNPKEYEHGLVASVYVPYHTDTIRKLPKLIKPTNPSAVVIGEVPYTRRMTRPYGVLYVFFQTEWEKEGFLLSVPPKTSCVILDHVSGHTEAWYHKSWKNLYYNPHANDTLAKRCQREPLLHLKPEDRIMRRIKLMTEKGCYRSSDNPNFCGAAKWDCRANCILCEAYESYINIKRERHARQNKKKHKTRSETLRYKHKDRLKKSPANKKNKG